MVSAKGNASDKVKNIAKYIAPSNNDDGILEIIDNISQIKDL
jgi:hydroxymethylpyrimidine pyrophosphatase-like HAD family hydrolase